MSKVYGETFGLEERWDQLIRLKAEIILQRPFGIWEGNTFSNIDVEVEYLNTKEVKAPVDLLLHRL